MFENFLWIYISFYKFMPLMTRLEYKIYFFLKVKMAAKKRLKGSIEN